MHKALLPTGLKDVLPPGAAHEADAVTRLLAVLAAQGYERVKPPLIEFEGSLLTGPGEVLASQSFRLMDPASQRMLAVRPDMTTQVARIATSRLRKAPRPLRLCYAGQVLRVAGSQMRPERQFTQVGAELVGARAPTADAEVAVMAAEALQAVGVAGLSLDLNLPPLVTAVADALGFTSDDTAALRTALDRKDAAAVDSLAGAHAPLFRGLLRAAGPVDTAMARLRALDLPGAVQPLVARLDSVQMSVREILPDLIVTADPVEHRGFEYQSGVSFALYAPGVHGELGRGGRYTANGSADGGGEPATGFTLFMDSVMRALPSPEPAARVYVPLETDAGAARQLRAAGWVTVKGLEPVTDAAAEAHRLGCGYWLGPDGVRGVAATA